jgi:type I restriction enzyme S subunit
MTRHGSWPLVALGDVIFNVQSGFASGERTADGVVQLRMNNVSTDGGLDLTNHIRVPTTTSQIAKYGLQPGDVLFNSTNSLELVGKTAVFAGFSEPVVFSNHFARLRVVPDKLDPYYLAQWLLVKWQQRIFEHLATAWVNQASVRKEDLLDLHLPLPPLAEQQRIAGLLRRADRLRRLRRYALEVSAGYLQAVFVEMFGDPVRNPMGWERIALGDLDTKFTYGTSEKCEVTLKGLPVLRIPNILSREIDLADLKYATLPASEVSKLKLQRGDLIFVRTNGNPDYVGRCAVFDLTGDFLFASYLIRARIGSASINPWFVDAFIRTAGGRREMFSYIRTTAGQSNIGIDGLAQILIPVPPVHLQNQYVKVIMRHQRLQVQQREALRQAEHLFQALLRRAFAGE